MKIISDIRDNSEYFMIDLENENLYIYDWIFTENKIDKEGNRNR